MALGVVHRLRCTQCGTTVGVAEGVDNRHKIYCSVLCSEFPAATDMYERNLLWAALIDNGWTPVSVGKMYGSFHSQVYRSYKYMYQVD